MAEQRLIDATSLKILFEHEYRHNKQFKQSSAYKAWQGAIQLLYDQPIIDPETLPIVRELRERLERVTAERDELKRRLAKYETTFNKENPALAKFLAETKTSVNACELCRALAHDLRALPMCENGDPCPLHPYGDHT